MAPGQGWEGFCHPGRCWGLKEEPRPCLLSLCPPSPRPALTHTPDVFVPGSLQSGHTSSLICSAPWACEQGTPPTFSWMGASVSHLDPSVTHSSVLRLNPRPQDHGTNLTCQVTLPGAFVTTRRTIRLSVSCESWARVRGPEDSGMGAQGLDTRCWVLESRSRGQEQDAGSTSSLSQPLRTEGKAPHPPSISADSSRGSFCLDPPQNVTMIVLQGAGSGKEPRLHGVAGSRAGPSSSCTSTPLTWDSSWWTRWVHYSPRTMDEGGGPCVPTHCYSCPLQPSV